MKYRKIWESVFGEIPKDENGISYEIHHKDGDRTNNNIENLQCISLKEHYEIHLKQSDYASAAFLKQKLGNPLTGWNHSDETKEKLRMDSINNPRRYWLGKKRPDIAEMRRNIFVSDETKKKQSEAKLKNPTKYWEGKSRKGMIVNHPILTCPHCGKTGKGESAMNRWHFDNCKQK
jgi:hypothetical protein